MYRRIPMQKCDFTKVEVTLLHGCFPLNWPNIRRTHSLENTSLWPLLYIWQSIKKMPGGICQFKVKMKKPQSYTESNVRAKNLLLYSHCSLHFPFQCCTETMVGFLVENSVSHCVNRSLINIECGDRGNCRGVTLVLSTIVGRCKICSKLIIKTLERRN